MKHEVIVAGLVIGACNYLLRMLPVISSKLFGEQTGKGALPGFLAAVGPAAIAALLVVSLLPELLKQPVSRWTSLAGVQIIIVSFRLKKNAALSTLLGALAYGIVLKILM